MGTISGAFGIISGALDADQSGLSTIANNVANASTAGYTREKPNFVSDAPIILNGVAVGTGVTDSGPVSTRDLVLLERLGQQQQLASASSARLSALDQVQGIFAPASGSTSSDAGNIGVDITGFFNSFSSLEASPGSNALRLNVLSTARTLAGDVSNAALSLDAQRSSLDQQTVSVAAQVNQITQTIAGLNQQIQSLSANSDAGVLEDQRQQQISQLSQLVGVNQVRTEGNGLSLTTTSGQLLLSGSTVVPMTTSPIGGVTHFFLGSTDVTTQLASGGGTLGGVLTARDGDIPTVQNALDGLAYAVSTAVNAQNNSGTDMAGNNGNAGNIFTAPTQVAGSALEMAVVMTDPNHIAAAGLNKGPGDNSNALALAALGTGSSVSGQTPSNFYAALISTLGSTVARVQADSTAQSASVTQLQTQNNALSQVNLNDEASAMTLLERSYQAASQVFSMINTVMASALNLGEHTTVS